ncbi:hypothetical protein MMC12_006303 [Toensbergia leucococca]|nr:hypothetical protein [Toensbergia leucococca]
MPVLTRRQQQVGLRGSASSRSSVDSNESSDRLRVVKEDFEGPLNEMDLPSAKLAKLPSRQKSKNALRISTYTKPELHDRYLSSEEELSPSPEDEPDVLGNAPKDEAFEILSDEPFDLSTIAEAKVELVTVVRVPFFAAGRPKLIDITNIAPMQKRKRPAKPLVQPIPKFPSCTTAHLSHPTNGIIDVAVPEPYSVPTRKNSTAPSIPESWLPDDDTIESTERFPPDHYFPEAPLELRRTPSYQDYDPYSLSPPRLSSSTQRSRGPMHRSIPVSTTLSTSTVSPASAIAKRKGPLSRTLNLAKKQSTLFHHPHLNSPTKPESPTQPQETAKKAKLVARGANDRDDPPYVPLLSRTSRVQPTAAMKKSKMMARGANEREEMLVLPDFPFED